MSLMKKMAKLISIDLKKTSAKITDVDFMYYYVVVEDTKRGESITKEYDTLEEAQDAIKGFIGRRETTNYEVEDKHLLGDYDSSFSKDQVNQDLLEGFSYKIYATYKHK